MAESEWKTFNFRSNSFNAHISIHIESISSEIGTRAPKRIPQANLCTNTNSVAKSIIVGSSYFDVCNSPGYGATS